MKHLILFLILSSNAMAQSGSIMNALQFIRDNKLQTVIQDTVTPANDRPLPVGISGTVPVTGTVAATQSGVWSVGRTWTLGFATDSIESRTFDGAGNAISSTLGALDVNIASGSITVSNPSVGLNNATAPTSSNLIGGIDGSGNLKPLLVDPSSNLFVNVNSSQLPIGAATELTLANIDSKITAVDTANVTVIASALPTNAAQESGGNLDTIAANQTNSTQKTKITDGTNDLDIVPLGTQVVTGDNGLVANAVIHGVNSVTLSSYMDARITPSGALLVDNSASTQPVSGTVTVQQATGTNLHAVVDSGTVAATQSGTWNINDISGTISLPTGAATSANQSTANSSLSSIDGKLASNYGVATGALRTASQVGNASGVADFGAGTTSSQTLRVVLPTDQSSIPVVTSGAANGSGSAAAATVSTVITLTAPANATGFILMNLDTSTANVRYAIGRTATTTLGQQLQPGRDSGFVPCGANVSLVAESGTQNYDIQWVSQ